MNESKQIRKDIKDYNKRLNEITEQMSISNRNMRKNIKLLFLFSLCLCFLGFSILLVKSILSFFLILSFIVFFHFVSLYYLNALNNSRRIYIRLFNEGVVKMRYLADKIDWSRIRKQYILSDETVSISAISKFLTSFDNRLSPVRRGFNYYRFILKIFWLGWEFTLLCVLMAILNKLTGFFPELYKLGFLGVL